ncbi:hypothetical protein EHQ58_17810 [Leptospira ognonensis]|uniref:Glycosyltransferase RgtA/B/C/D-like domain-containing protein n=1 Tax=Leptospira ognonensis TaxID=2484945 RepID=A0A4R9JWR0_9LEPT|nr:hypothetical protein [Leptospira ognonensis]TGL56474.1 hypothetical protein EHQ58_17810 [Leptospira ognonensis]
MRRIQKIKAKFSLNLRYLSSVLILFFLLFFNFPSLGYEAEFYAETGNNFFYHAKFTSFLESLSIPEAGYLPLTQRLVSFLIVQTFDILSWSPLAFQICALLGFSLLVSFINLNGFRKLIPSDSVRYLTGFLLGLYPNWEMFTFINFIYFGYIYLLLVLFLDVSRKSNFVVLLFAFIGFLLVASKALLLAIAPAAGILSLYHFYTKKYKNLLVASSVTLGALLQSAFSYMTLQRSNKVESTLAAKSLEHILSLGYEMLVDSWIQFMIPKSFGSFIYEDFRIIIITALLFSLMILFMRRSYQPIFFILTLLSATFIGNLLFLQFVGEDYFPLHNQYLSNGLPFHRWYFIPHLSAILLFTLLIFKIKYRVLRFFLFAFFVINLPTLPKFAEMTPPYDDKVNSNSQWVTTLPLLKSDSFCIPINPEPWYISRYCAETSAPQGKKILAILVKLPLKEKDKKPETCFGLDENGKKVMFQNVFDKSMYQFWTTKEPKIVQSIHFINSEGKELEPQASRYYAVTH